MLLEPKAFCTQAAALPNTDLRRLYHDTEHGLLPNHDDELFGRFLLCVMEAGIGVEAILRKKEWIRRAFANYRLEEIAAFGEQEIEALREDGTIVRNERKIRSIVYNAGAVLELREFSDSWRHWLLEQHPRSTEQWGALFKTHFQLSGGQIFTKFLVGTGFLEGAHTEDCPMYQVQEASKVPFTVV